MLTAGTVPDSVAPLFLQFCQIRYKFRAKSMNLFNDVAAHSTVYSNFKKEH